MSRISSPEGRKALASVQRWIAGPQTDELVAELVVKLAGVDAAAAEWELEAARLELAEYLTRNTPVDPQVVEGIAIAVIEAARDRLAEVNAIGVGRA